MTKLLSRRDQRGLSSGYNRHFSGSSVTRGNKTDFFDARGFYQGTTTRQGTPSNPLGNVDGSDPFGRKRWKSYEGNAHPAEGMAEVADVIAGVIKRHMDGRDEDEAASHG